ncbi:MAG: MotA/TolQ/ExbB proton channel family protein [Chlamydiota bacterium]
MKKISSLVLISILTVTSGFSSEPEIIDLENELLSLEHEFLSSLEEINSPSLELEEPFTEDPFASVISETQEDSPFITEQTIAEEAESESVVTTISTSEPVQEAIATPLLSYPHEEKAQPSASTLEISFQQVFSNSPFIYSILLGMSFTSIAICLYIILRVRQQTAFCDKFSKEVRHKFLDRDFKEASTFCSKNHNWLSKIVLSGINCKKYGLNAVLENMKSEGKRATISSWQQLGILQDIAIISPMLGLLGTVIGLFYAFYDLNRSFNSISNLLDGLGISVGTTVAGICVAILSMILHSMTKFRLVRSLAKIEVEASSLAYLIDEDNGEV